jgi:hypothetical protein
MIRVTTETLDLDMDDRGDFEVTTHLLAEGDIRLIIHTTPPLHITMPREIGQVLEERLHEARTRGWKVSSVVGGAA